MLRVRQVWVLSYRIAGTVEVYEDYDEARQAGINYITYIGDDCSWDTDEINDEISEFNRSDYCETVSLQLCAVKEARQ